MSHHVFISYSSKDKEIADLICNELEKNKVECWIAPKNITPGKEWGEEIVNAINQSQIMVLVFSSSSNTSQQVLREVERAVNKNVIIVPFRIEDVLPTKSMEYFLYSTHWFDANISNMQKSIKQLVEIVKRLINEPDSQENEINIYDKSGYKRKNKNAVYLSIGAILVTVIIVLSVILYVQRRDDNKYSSTKKTNINVINNVSSNKGRKNGDNNISSNSSRSNKINKSYKKIDHLYKGYDKNKKAKAVSVSKAKDIHQKSHKIKYESNTAIINKKNIKNKSVSKKSTIRGIEKTTSTQVNTRNLATNSSIYKGSTEKINNKSPKDRQPNKSSNDSVYDKNNINLKIGDYINFGTYNNSTIEWRVINIDGNGNPLLLSTRILTLKAFDAAESGNYNKTGNSIEFDVHKQRADVYKEYSALNLRKMKGNNYWTNSNIREWLNSSAKKVEYKTQPPIASAVSGETNSYDDEPGFLHFFSEKERNLIKIVDHKVIVPSSEKNKKQGGSELFSFSRAKLSDALFNYKKSYYENVKDKVFLLSIEDSINFVADRGWDLKTGLTPEAIAKDKSGWYKDLSGQTEGLFMWWLITPMASSPSDVCIVGPKGDIIYNDYAALAGIGIRPALSLDCRKLKVVGNGTESSPYVVK